MFEILFVFVSHALLCLSFAHQQISRYELRLMDLVQDHSGIPEENYACIVRMPSMEFARICRDVSQFGESMVIACTQEGKQSQLFIV